MSAFVCGPDHFKALALFATSRGNWGYPRVDPRLVRGLVNHIVGLNPTISKPPEQWGRTRLASAYADVLYKENIRSVGERYPDDTRDTLPGPIVKPLHIVVSGEDESNASLRLPPVSILKMLDCLDYQSCETNDWTETLAYRLVHHIRSAAISDLPGYEAAPWDYYIEERAA